MFGIHINSIPDKYKRIKPLGKNPFDYIGLKFNNDGTRATPLEYEHGKWIEYRNFETLALKARPQEERNNAYKLSIWFPVYDWIADDGFKNFSKWID